MTYVKRIVCLANSWKDGGSCVAGREFDGHAWGGWIRPVSTRPKGALRPNERCYQDGGDPAVGDIIEVPLKEPRPDGYQQENHVIDEEHRWGRSGQCSWAALQDAVEAIPNPLWLNGHQSSNGVNNRVPAADAATLTRSLYLARTEHLLLSVRAEWGGARKVRGEFTMGGVRYRLSVTDPVVAEEYKQQPDGTHAIPLALLCLSLGEVFDDGCAYKLIAAVIKPARLGG